MSIDRPSLIRQRVGPLGLLHWKWQTSLLAVVPKKVETFKSLSDQKRIRMLVFSHLKLAIEPEGVITKSRPIAAGR